MNEQSSEKAELALISYLKTKCPESLEFYPGHTTEEVTHLPRAVVTFSEGGPELCPGVDNLTGEIHVLGFQSKRKPSDPVPPPLATFVNPIREALCEESLDELLAFINIPPAGADTREVKGFGMSSIAFLGFVEGRDSDKNLHGVILRYQAYCHLEAEG